MLTLTPVVLQLVQLGIAVAPDVIEAALTEISLLDGTTPTAAQQQAIDAAMAAAHAALQAAQPAAS